MLLKEGFSEFYDAETEEEAKRVLRGMDTAMRGERTSPVSQIGETIDIAWSGGILAYFTHRITNGVAEGINNKIKVIKRRSYGFRDMDYFFLKILRATGFIPPIKEVYP